MNPRQTSFPANSDVPPHKRGHSVHRHKEKEIEKAVPTPTASAASCPTVRQLMFPQLHVVASVTGAPGGKLRTTEPLPPTHGASGDLKFFP